MMIVILYRNQYNYSKKKGRRRKMKDKQHKISELITTFIDWFHEIRWASKAIFILSILFTITNIFLNNLSDRYIEVTNSVVDTQISEVESAAEALSDTNNKDSMDILKTGFAEIGNNIKKLFAVPILVIFAIIGYYVGKVFDIPKRIVEWLAGIDNNNKIIEWLTEINDDGKFLYAFLLYDTLSLVFNLYTIYGLITVSHLTLVK